MSILQTILGRQNKAPVPVPTPEWPELDGKLAVRKLTPVERVEFYALSVREKPEVGIQFQSLVATYCTILREAISQEAIPQRAFADEHWKALSGDPGSGSAIERLSDAADEANILSDGAREAVKKKYEPPLASGNTSESPASSESATPRS